MPKIARTSACLGARVRSALVPATFLPPPRRTPCRPYKDREQVGAIAIAPTIGTELTLRTGGGDRAAAVLAMLRRRAHRGARLLAVGAVAAMIWAWGVAQHP